MGRGATIKVGRVGRFRRWTYVFGVTALTAFLIGGALTAFRDAAFEATSGVFAPTLANLPAEALPLLAGDDASVDAMCVAAVQPEFVSRALAREGAAGVVNQREFRVQVQRAAPAGFQVAVLSSQQVRAMAVANSIAKAIADEFNTAARRTLEGSLVELREAARFAAAEQASCAGEIAQMEQELTTAAAQPAAPVADITPTPAQPEPVAETRAKNPAWEALRRDLDEVQSLRLQLLARYTAEHPQMKHLDSQHADLSRQLAGVPEFVAGGTANAPVQRLVPTDTPTSSPALAPPAAVAPHPGDPHPAPLQARLAELRTLAANGAAAAEAAQAELAQWQQHSAAVASQGWRATMCDTPATVAAGATRLPTTTLLGLAMIVGLTFSVLAVGTRPPFETVADVREAVQIPIVGVLPSADGAGPRPRPVRWLATAGSRLCEAALVTTAIALVAAIFLDPQLAQQLREDPLSIFATPQTALSLWYARFVS